MALNEPENGFVWKRKAVNSDSSTPEDIEPINACLQDKRNQECCPYKQQNETDEQWQRKKKEIKSLTFIFNWKQLNKDWKMRVDFELVDAVRDGQPLALQLVQWWWSDCSAAVVTG